MSTSSDLLLTLCPSPSSSSVWHTCSCHIQSVGTISDCTLQTTKVQHKVLPSIHFPYLLVPVLKVTGVSWTLSQLSSGKGRVALWSSRQLTAGLHRERLHWLASLLFCRPGVTSAVSSVIELLGGEPSNLQPSCCEAAALTFVPLCRPNSKQSYEKKGKSNMHTLLFSK